MSGLPSYKRINLSPFTKDFRGGGQSKTITIFLDGFTSVDQLIEIKNKILLR